MNEQTLQPQESVSTPSVDMSRHFDARQVISRIYFWTGIISLSPFVYLFLRSLYVIFAWGGWEIIAFASVISFLFLNIPIILCNFLRLIVAKQIKKQNRFSKIMTMWIISLSIFLIAWFVTGEYLGYPKDINQQMSLVFYYVALLNLISWIFMDPYLLWITYRRGKKNNL